MSAPLPSVLVTLLSTTMAWVYVWLRYFTRGVPYAS